MTARWHLITDNPPSGIIWITDGETALLVYFKDDGCHLVTGGWLEWDEDGEWNGEGYKMVPPETLKKFTHWYALILPKPVLQGDLSCK